MTRSIHENWCRRTLHSSFVTRYAHTVYHNLALGRGPIRAITQRDMTNDLKTCRHGCGCVEDLNHLLMECKKVQSQRKAAEEVLKTKGLKLCVKTLLSCEAAREKVEKLILTFLA